MLRTIHATRYVTPLREGGSLPAIVEAEDLGLYVLKFRGAGQGPLALVAEMVGGEIGRALGLKVPELVFMEVDPVLARNEPDQEIRDLLNASAGLNLALDYLPGSIMFDPAARLMPDSAVASGGVWFDAFITNVDRTARNPNLLWWHKTLYFIDQGAALYFHHDWNDIERKAANPFPAIRDHVLLKWADQLQEMDERFRRRLSEALFTAIVDQIPAEWLPGERRSAYVDYLMRRLAASPAFVEEALRARAQLV
ncbi:MAG: aminotransferase class I and II [Acidobacteriota bacterium]|nr:aminotransferase class I and II [Acidobacteriota bacterium]